MMATINKVIEQVGRTKPNALSDEDKARWLLELDKRIYEEITKEADPERTPPEAFPRDGEQELVVKAPYDNLYELYLTAMVEYWMREYDAYNNTVTLFQQAYDEFRARWRRDHRPTPMPGFNVLH